MATARASAAVVGSSPWTMPWAWRSCLPTPTSSAGPSSSMTARATSRPSTSPRKTPCSTTGSAPAARMTSARRATLGSSGGSGGRGAGWAGVSEVPSTVQIVGGRSKAAARRASTPAPSSTSMCRSSTGRRWAQRSPRPKARVGSSSARTQAVPFSTRAAPPGPCLFPSGARGRGLGDLGEELVVALGGLDLVHQQFEARSALQGVEDPPKLPDLLELGALEEELLVAGGRAVHVDGGVDAPLGQFAVEAQLHVAGALELLEDDLVHPRTRLDEGGGEDRQRPTLFDVPGRPEELLGWVQSRRVDAAGEDAARRRRRQVVGPGQAGDAVEDDDDV